MLRTIFFAIIFWIVLILSILLLIPLLLIKFFRLNKVEEKFTINFCALWSRIMFAAAGLKIVMFGKEKIPKHNRVCFVSNHQSYGDIPMIMGCMGKRVGFIAKKELDRVPILNVWIRSIHCILIDRTQGRQALRAIEIGMEQISEGFPKVIFPEGTRAKNGKMQKFKAGGLQMAVRQDITLIPVTIDGMFRTYEETKRVTATTAKVIIHDPIDTKGMTRDERKELTAKVENIIQSALPEEYRITED